MYKQTHIFAFILVSLSLHVVILAKLQPSTPESSFIKSDKLLRVELSSKSVPVSTPKKTITKTTAAAVNKNQPKHIKTKRESFHSKPENISTKVTTDNKVIEHIVKTNIDENLVKNELIDKKRREKEQERRSTQIENEINSYKREITSIIEGNKYYPDSARRRNIEDTVKVTFNLLKSGEVDDINISGHYKLLKIAAKTAILDSVPFQTSSFEMNFPLRITYSMSFTLN